MPVLNTSIEIIGIASVLSSARHVVPVYQRSFVWTEQEEEVEEFLTDISDAFNREKEPYFLGSIVVIGGKGVQQPTVVDGQQRLAVTLLLMAHIAEKFLEFGEAESHRTIRNDYIAKYDIKQKATLPQLSLNMIDDSFFQALLQGKAKEPLKGAPESHIRLWQANRLIATWLSKQISSKDNPAEWLVEFIEYLKFSAYIIYFAVPDDANAFLIFETMNDRGLDLSIADLLKNYLLGRVNQADIPKILGKWTTSVGSLNIYGGEDLYKLFLRQFWISKHGLVREKHLYRSIKSRVSTAANASDFADELVLNSYLYTAILSPDHVFWNEATQKTREYVSILNILGLEQYRPTLLSALAYFAMAEIAILLKLLVSWSVRLLIVGNIGGGTIEYNYGELGQMIRNGKLKTIKDIAKYANKTFVPNDSVFRSSFASATLSKSKFARYYLRTLEIEAGGETQRELVPNPDSSELTLEHILPERPEKDAWKQFNEDDRKLYTRRLGNMVLLKEKMNSKLRSGPFIEKKKIYNSSKLVLTREAGEFSKWTKESVIKRQEYLADLAVKAWGIQV